MTPEAKVKSKVHAALKAAGAYAVNYIGGQYATAGTPDILACFEGTFIGIEVKAGKNKPTALQIHALTQIDKAGGLALVITEGNVSYLQACLTSIAAQQSALSNYTEFK